MAKESVCCVCVCVCVCGVWCGVWCKEKPERGDELVRKSADLLAVTREDTGSKEELEHCFDAWVRCCDEAEAAQEQKSLVEEELMQCFERYKATWELVVKKTEAVASKTWQSNTKSQHLDSVF